jgi:hypothetical protein
MEALAFAELGFGAVVVGKSAMRASDEDGAQHLMDAGHMV